MSLGWVAGSERTVDDTARSAHQPAFPDVPTIGSARRFWTLESATGGSMGLEASKAE
jgi:hypothetical protein